MNQELRKSKPVRFYDMPIANHHHGACIHSIPDSVDTLIVKYSWWALGRILHHY